MPPPTQPLTPPNPTPHPPTHLPIKHRSPDPLQLIAHQQLAPQGGAQLRQAGVDDLEGWGGVGGWVGVGGGGGGESYLQGGLEQGLGWECDGAGAGSGFQSGKSRHIIDRAQATSNPVLNNPALSNPNP